MKEPKETQEEIGQGQRRKGICYTIKTWLGFFFGSAYFLQVPCKLMYIHGACIEMNQVSL